MPKPQKNTFFALWRWDSIPFEFMGFHYERFRIWYPSHRVDSNGALIDICGIQVIWTQARNQVTKGEIAVVFIPFFVA